MQAMGPGVHGQVGFHTELQQRRKLVHELLVMVNKLLPFAREETVMQQEALRQLISEHTEIALSILPKPLMTSEELMQITRDRE